MNGALKYGGGTKLGWSGERNKAGITENMAAAVRTLSSGAVRQVEEQEGKERPAYLSDK